MRLIEFLPECFALMRNLRCAPPVLVGISLIGVRGSRLLASRVVQGIEKIDRDVLMLPNILVEDLSVRVDQLLKPTLDLVWNACGVASSPYFDANGNWTGGVR